MSDRNPLARAYDLAKENGFFIAQVWELRDRRIPDSYVKAYVLYRKPAFEGAKPDRIGRRRDCAALLSLLKKQLPEVATT